ncbi:alpha/beta fold hydrolase [Synoicihabitans lomoniglobus]|uniref:Alpha/beta fold hydrolase n=1 Tax=Synoicihabitans lomoniglobus TaxID=2909285 RepID=A0AAF0I4J2_9BACT|nr:alpha/beta fold hydrolase [Opitutaceae bacterium LMO-M01]WED66824.1 alpha/beta fold hydrolase [Opitutaceae bacterium LMO-M01]
MNHLPAWLRELYPFTPQRFTTPSGAGMSYVDEGEGTEAVLMLHGNPTWSFYYRDLVKAIAPKKRCIVPDHIGMGLSEKPENYAYTLATRIDDIAALVESLGLTKVDLVVHDWGGAIGFGFAQRRPDLIGRITILNTAAFTSIHLPRRIALCKFGGVGPALVRGVNAFAWPATWMAMSRRALSNDENRGYLYPYDSWANRVAVSAFVQDIPMRPSHPTWPTLQIVEDGIAKFRDRDVLILWGGRDFCFNDQFFKEWETRLPQAKTMYLEDAGHYVLEDARGDAIPRICEHLLQDKRTV